jgi:ADP-ribosylation factor-like protein 8
MVTPEALPIFQAATAYDSYAARVQGRDINESPNASLTNSPIKKKSRQATARNNLGEICLFPNMDVSITDKTPQQSHDSLLAVLKALSKSTTLNMVLIGLENSGKTTLLSALAHGYPVEIVPTIGLDVKVFQKGRIQMKCWDNIDQCQWSLFCKRMCDVVLFVIDASDSHNLSTAKEELHKLINDGSIGCSALLVIANKIDIQPHVGDRELTEMLELDYLEDTAWMVVPISALHLTNVNQPTIEFTHEPAIEFTHEPAVEFTHEPSVEYTHEPAVESSLMTDTVARTITESSIMAQAEHSARDDDQNEDHSFGKVDSDTHEPVEEFTHEPADEPAASVVPSPPPGLSEYEMMRQLKIKRNQERLASLGLLNSGGNISAAPGSSTNRRTEAARKSAITRKENAKRGLTRHSLPRKAKQKSGGGGGGEDDDDDEDEVEVEDEEDEEDEGKDEEEEENSRFVSWQ